jgi:hypothetical protein
MYVSGFSIIKNAIKFDYPIVESIKSILPVCDEFVIAVGKSDDDTLNLIRSIDPSKVKIIETVWDDSLREGGVVLSVETNKALDHISAQADWAFYIQGDEVMHEKDLPAIKEAMLKYKDDEIVEGLLFDHINFYGSYDYIANSRKWSKKEIRIIRKNKSIRSYKDAMSFRHTNGDKVKVKKIDAMIYHYGWVKPPSFQLEKRKNFEKLWHNDNWVEKTFSELEEFDYSKIDSLENFSGTHPSVMHERIQRTNWRFSFDPTKNIKLSLRLRILNFIYRTTGWNIGEFKSYKLI